MCNQIVLFFGFIILFSCDQEIVDQGSMLATINNESKLIDTLVDCNKTFQILLEIERSDQGNRVNGLECIDKEIDHKNLSVVVSILEHCKPESGLFKREEINAIWLVLQHSNLEYAIEYFELLASHVNHGLLSRQDLLMMLDRILLNSGAAQEYGTQVCRNRKSGKWKLCEPYNIDSIRVRRAKGGFSPIEDYVKHWNIIID